MSDITIAGKLNNPFGFAADGDQVELVPPSGNGNLPSTLDDVQDLLRIIDGLSLGGGSNLDISRITSLESKMAALFPLTANVDKLDSFADDLTLANTTETVTITNGYSLIADFRGTPAADHYESAGVTYTDGTNVIRYSGLTNNLHRAFGFKVTTPSAQTLMNIVDGSTLIPFVRMTAAGNFEVNNYSPAEEVAQNITRQPHSLTRSAGTDEVTTAPGSVATFTLPNYPTGATNGVRGLDFDVQIFLSGVDSLAARFADLPQDETPNTNVAQAKRTRNVSVSLGPLHGNRTVTVTVGYEFRVVGDDLLVDLTLENAPSGVTVSFRDVVSFLSYTATQIRARVDNWQRFQDAGADYTFTGENELLISFQPHNYDNSTAVVGGAIGATGAASLFNDLTVRVPTPSWNVVEIPDTIEFRTFIADHFLIHNDLGHFLTKRAIKWAYQLARLDVITGLALTAPIDLASGSSLNGVALVQPEVVVYQATGKGTSSGELVASVVLPVNYGDFKYIHVTEYDNSSLQWRHTEIPTEIFTSGNVAGNDNVRLQGNTVMQWTAGTRTLAMNPSAQEIYRVTLKD